MRFRPQSVDELDPNIRWGIELQLQLLEEVVLPALTTLGSAHPAKKKRWERVL